MRKLNFPNSVSLFVFLYTVIPFTLLCFYNVPIGDDFWFADAFRNKGFWGTQSAYYHEWSGRYIATATISGLNPASYGNFTLFFIHPLLLIFGFAWALYHLVKNAVTTFNLGVDPKLLFAFLFFFYCNYVPDFGETFYWMAGAFTYQLPVVFFLAYLNSLFGLLKAKSGFSVAKYALFALVSLVIAVGCNEVMTVYVNAANGLILLYFLLQKNYLNRFTALFFIGAIVSFFMITAPGNFVRGALFDLPEYHLLKTCAQALSRSGFVLVFWITSLLLILLCMPRQASTETSVFDKIFFFVKTRRAFVITSLVFIIALTFIGFFPSIYATKWIPQRAYTPIFLVFMIAGSLLLFALMQKSEVLTKVNGLLADTKVGFVLLPLLALGLSQNSNVMNAYVDLTSGKASSYHAQVLATYEEMRTNKDTVIVNPIAKKPMVLPYRWPGGNGLADAQLAQYFDIKTLIYTGNQ